MTICGEYGILPDSYIIPEPKIQQLGDSPVPSSGFPDLWQGKYEDKSVAIKVIKRYQASDSYKMQKVRYFDLFCSSGLTFCRTFAERS